MWHQADRVNDYFARAEKQGDAGADSATVEDDPGRGPYEIIRDGEPRADGTLAEEDVIVESMAENDVCWFVTDPRIGYCSDGGLCMQHPRSAGTFPRILGYYVREQKALRLEEAIYKMTLLPAQHIGLRDRGKITPRYVADLVLFDPVRFAIKPPSSTGMRRRLVSKP